jgi:CO/xanthine dehydrogenase Mo-binding subunit
LTGDTEITPDAGPSTGSRLVYYVGNAAKDSAVKLRDALLSTASGLLERPVDALELREGRVYAFSGNGSISRFVTLAEVAQARKSARQPLRFDGIFDPTSLIYNPETGEEKPYAVYVTATHLAEVEVDMERGNVRVIRIVAAHDVGWAVYPLGLKGQIDGAVAMGVGLALKEEYVPGETVGFKQYRMPTARDVPEVVMLLVETGDPSADLGAKGVAECATVAVAPAIINAVADAIGAHPTDLPVTPARLMSLIGRSVG